MRKIFLLAALSVSSFAVHATPGTGGYLGHRLIIGAEMAYAPSFITTPKFYRLDFQYGVNAAFIVGRCTQIGLTYDMFSLGGNQEFETAFAAGDRVKGAQYGITVRNFRKKRGGIAPIGKFWDVSLGYAQMKFVSSSGNHLVMDGGQDMLPKTSGQLTAHLGFGTQMVFWNRVVANTGVRFGAPLEISSDSKGTYHNFLQTRNLDRELFSVFFGVGILL